MVGILGSKLPAVFLVLYGAESGVVVLLNILINLADLALELFHVVLDSSNFLFSRLSLLYLAFPRKRFCVLRGGPERRLFGIKHFHLMLAERVSLAKWSFGDSTTILEDRAQLELLLPELLLNIVGVLGLVGLLKNIVRMHLEIRVLQGSLPTRAP